VYLFPPRDRGIAGAKRPDAALGGPRCLGSKLWLGIAATMAMIGSRTGRPAALTGVAARAINSAAVNLVAKLSIRRGRPDPAAAGVPEARRVEMPSSLSFPSGHAASGFAFAEAVADTMPGMARPLRLLAAVVAYSRVHTGVHYPSDVIAGSLIGFAAHVRGARQPLKPAPAKQVLGHPPTSRRWPCQADGWGRGWWKAW
jgi:membrane-associated phospholipid phosphatase